MKKFITLFSALLLSTLMFAGQLVLVKTGSGISTKKLFQNPVITVHYFTEDYAIATCEGQASPEFVVLDENAWTKTGQSYYLLKYDAMTRENYIPKIEKISDILYKSDHFMVIRIADQHSEYKKQGRPFASGTF